MGDCMTNDGRGKYLKELREAARLSLDDIADEFGMSRQQILNYETGKTPVGAERFVKLVMTINKCYNDANERYKAKLSSLQAGDVREPAAATA